MKTLTLLLCLLVPMIARAQIEEIAGEVHAVIIDYVDAPVEVTAIVPRVGRPVFLPRGVHLPPGQVRLRGRRRAALRHEIGDAIELEAAPTPVSPPAAWGDVTENLGPQRTVAVLVSFTDRPDPIATLDTLRAAHADWVVPFYDEISESRTATVPEFYRVELPIPATCQLYPTMLAVVAALDSQVDWTSVDFLPIAGPFSGCGFRGIAPLGPKRPCIETADGLACFGYNLTDSTIPLKAIGLVTDHEQGHSYGTHHSGFFTCGPGTSLRPAPRFFCGVLEYGGLPSDMGCADCAGHFDAVQKEGIGLLAGGRYLDVTAPGQYRIACNDTIGSSLPKGLRLVRGAGLPNAFAIECRTTAATRFSRELMLMKPTCDWPRGINLQVLDGHAAKPMLIDATVPAGMLPSNCTSALLPGETWTDPVMGLSVHLASRTETEAAVDVLALGMPDLSMPSVTITSLVSGQRLSGTIEVCATITDDHLEAAQFYSTPPWPSRHGTIVAPGPYCWTVDTTAFPNGGHWWWVEASDSVGNRIVVQAPYTVIDNGVLPTTTTTVLPTTSTTTTRVTTSSTTTRPPITTTMSSTTSTTRPSTTTTTTRVSTTTTTLICLAWGEVCGGPVLCCSGNCKGGWWKKRCR